MAKDNTSSKTSSSKTKSVSAAATVAAPSAPSAASTSDTVDYTKLPKARDVMSFTTNEFDFNKLVIYDPVLTKTDKATFYRAKVGYVYPDNTVGAAIYSLGKKYCYGVQADNLDKDGKVLVDKDTGKPQELKGYRAPIVIAGKHPTDQDKIDADFYESLQAHIQKWAFDNRAKFGKAPAKQSAIESLVPFSLWRKKNPDGSFVEDSSKIFYTPLNYYVKDKRCDTVFYDMEDKSIDPLNVKGHCWIVPTVCIASVFLGAKTISPQQKLYDATVELISQGPRKRLATKDTLGVASKPESEDGDQSDVSLENSDSDSDSDN